MILSVSLCNSFRYNRTIVGICDQHLKIVRRYEDGIDFHNKKYPLVLPWRLTHRSACDGRGGREPGGGGADRDAV